jgi:hypothetical protein
VKFRKHQRKDQNLFNPVGQVKRKWKIIYPPPLPSCLKREEKSAKDLAKIVLLPLTSYRTKVTP